MLEMFEMLVCNFMNNNRALTPKERQEASEESLLKQKNVGV